MAGITFVAVATLGQVSTDGALAVDINGRSILICNSDGRVFAVENLCSHAQQTLECGRVKYGWISCPTHGARFDLESGEPLNGPATQPIATFAVRIVGDSVEVAL